MMNISKKTKIVASVADNKCDEELLRGIFSEGANVVRMNTAHISAPEDFLPLIQNTRKIDDGVALLIDTKGPEVRTTKIDGDDIHVRQGDRVEIVGKPELLSTPELLSVNYDGFVQDVPVGATILIDDGSVGLTVVEKTSEKLICTVQNEGEIGSRKSVNVPEVRINLPAISEKDLKCLHFACEHDIDFVAHSFVRSKEDIHEVQAILDEHNSDIKIIAKIENQEGVDNIDEIIDACYGIMIARGDLGVEVDMEKVPAIQRMIIKKCMLKKKPVIVATEMLNSMIKNPRPTRAEVSDVANAVLAQTDAIMLSGETAKGKYPIEAVRTMARIARETEKYVEESDLGNFKGSKDITDVTSYLAKYTVKAVNGLGVKAIINDSYSGRTTRNLSSFRSEAPIFAICNDKRVYRQLALSYGVIPFYQEKTSDYSKENYLIKGIHMLMDKGLVEKDDLIAYLGGKLFDEIGTTSLELYKVSDVIDFNEK